MAGNMRALKRKLEPEKGEQDPGTDGAPSAWLQEKVSQLRKDSSGVECNQDRVRFLSEWQKVKQGTGGVMYWMFRDQRVQDNWALIYAQQLALEENLPLHVCFCLVPRYLEYTYRQYAFMLKGLQYVAKECQSLDIQFHLVRGDPKQVIPDFIKDWNVGALVADFTPLRLPLQWTESISKQLPPDVPFIQVDAHNVVPCWVASTKQEYSARTIRGKIHKVLPNFLKEFPPVETHPHHSKKAAEKVDWEEVMSSLEVDRSLGEVPWAQPGGAAGMAMLESFIDQRLRIFGTQRNDPNAEALSKLSPWFHSGQLSTQRALLAVQRWGKKYSQSVASFTEELLVRRELADNFCYYNQHYDSIQGAYDWARATLKDHAKDPRQYVYTRKQLEDSETHDPLWNAAQRQLHLEGKMHGFMRMYWAKKILEWTASPEEALDIALYFNDHYALDGCDPNGYVGCMWSICAIHDQGWAERPIFGKVRYMNYAGCKRKFDVARFESKYALKKV